MATFIKDREILNVNKELVRQAQASLVEKRTASAKLTPQQKLEAYNKLDKEAKAQLRTEFVDLNVPFTMIGMDFFETITLQPDEVPGYELDDRRPRIPVYVTSQFGAPSQTIWSANNTRTLFDLGMIESDKVRTQRWDLYQGFVNKNDKLNADILKSVNYKLDDMAWVAIATAIGALDSDTWILDSKIKNAPTTNSLDLSSECDGKLTKSFFKGVTEHFDRVGKPIRAVWIPAARKHDLFDWVSVSDTDTPATETITPAMQEEIWRNGLPGGKLMPTCIFTNMLEGETEGSIYAYALCDPIGYFFQKPAFHYTDESDEGQWHYAQTFITASFVVPAYRMMNIAKIKIG